MLWSMDRFVPQKKLSEKLRIRVLKKYIIGLGKEKSIVKKSIQ